MRESATLAESLSGLQASEVHSMDIEFRVTSGFLLGYCAFFSLVVWAALRFVLRGRRGTFEHKLVLGP